MKLYVEIIGGPGGTFEHDGEEYGEWHEHNDIIIGDVYIGYKLSNTRRYSSEVFTVNYTVSPGDKVYVLVMTYSTGDSFGSSTGHKEVLWVFKDLEVAKDARKEVHDQDQDYDINFVTDGGKIIKLSNPAAGYFEHLEDLEVLERIVEERFI